MTQAQFETAVQPSPDIRAAIREKEQELAALIDQRDDIDKTSLTLCDKVVKAVVDDDNYGNDSPLYEAMGYVRKSEKKSGLTRKKKESAKP